jgi:hypothetical protein
MTLYALAESRAVMRFYQALESKNKTEIYERYWNYKDLIEEIRLKSLEEEKKIDEEFRKRFK